MKAVYPLLFSVLLSPLPGLAQTPATPTLVVPGVVTTTGEKFAARCDDEAFRQAPDPDKLARKCQRLLAQWHAEATRHEARRGNSRVDSATQVAQRPSDETLVWGGMPAYDWAKPLQATYSHSRLR